MKSTPDIKQMLKEAGLKATPSRAAILQALLTTTKPETVLSIAVRAGESGTDLVTAYRTLASFEEAGLARRVDIRQDAVSYELAGHHHHHIVCTECGTTEDFAACGMDAVARSVASKAKKFSSVREHALELFGVCDACS